MSKLRIKLVRSSVRRRFDQKRTVRALGLRKLGQTVEHSDSPSMRGMISKVRHLVAVEEAEE
jgi:large subunit ribosomal protein L30